MTGRMLLALALAAAAGALPFATHLGPVLIVLSRRHERGIHLGDLAAIPLAAAAIHTARKGQP